MNIRHVEEVKKAVGENGIAVLSRIFEKTTPPIWVPALRFRADYPTLIPEIDKLENSGLLLEHSPDRAKYRVKLFALPLLALKHAILLLQDMDTLFPVLQRLYREHLTHPFALRELEEATSIDKARLRELFFYMLDAHNFWRGHSSEFPFGDEPSLSFSEGILTHKSFFDIITQVYEWNFVNIRKNVPTWEGLVQQINNGTGQGFFTDDDVSESPGWYEDLDATMKAVIGEVDTAMRAGLSALPTVGVRILLDLIMRDKGYASGPFKQRLEQFADAGFISGQHKNVLDIVLDTGSAAAHRAHFPSNEDLRTCADVVKHLLHAVYVLEPRAEKLRDNTPQREK